jgi:hypothetical protein
MVRIDCCSVGRVFSFEILVDRLGSLPVRIAHVYEIRVKYQRVLHMTDVL